MHGQNHIKNGNAYFCLVKEVEVPCSRLPSDFNRTRSCYKGKGKCLEGTKAWKKEL